MFKDTNPTALDLASSSDSYYPVHIIGLCDVRVASTLWRRQI